jgi:phage-related tail fiber protein
MKFVAVAALGAAVLMAGSALAGGPAPNTAMGVGMGGGVYYNPYAARQQVQPQARNQQREVGTTEEGGGVYRVPGAAPQG